MKPLLAIPALLLALSISAPATSIGINFYNSNNPGAHTIPAGENAGICPLAGSLWNQFGFAFGVATNTLNTPLSDNNGTPNAANLTFTLDQSYVGNSGATGSPVGNQSMMASYLAWDPVDGTTPEDTGDISITGLGTDFTTPGYDVYVYFDADANNRTFTFTLNGVSSTASTDSTTWNGPFREANLFPADGNVAIFRNLTAATLTLLADSNTGRAAVNAIQIVSTDHPLPPTIESFTADDYYITPGDSTTLSWETTGATTLTLNPGTIDLLPSSTDGDGDTPTTVSSTTTYTLTASNPAGTTTATIRIGAGPPRPNIIFFLVDDMGWQDTSEPFLYDASGNEVITPLNNRYQTPSMELLADRGMKFTNAYAMPVCTPTRNCWITGLNSARHHVTNWTNPAGTDTDSNSTISHNSPGAWISGGLPDSLPTLPALLQSVGYRTIHAGKAHFGATSYAKEPLNIGFDINIAGSEIGHPGSYSGDYGQSTNRPVPDLQEYHNTGTHLSDALTLEMNKAIETSVNEGAPFFAYMAHYAVHAPFQTDPRFSANYPTLSGGELAYATLLEGMDKSLGDILTKLEALGIAENTLVIFMSDNGGDGPLGNVNNSNAPLRHKKGSKYEGGVREPFITAWAKPDGANSFQTALPIPAGTHQDDIIAVFDLFPTFASIAGATFTNPTDGYDLTPYFSATPGTHRPQELLIHFPHDHRSDYFTIFREGDWKLIYNFPTDSYELYNLATDLSEATDLAASEPDRVMAMSRKMAQQLNAAGAQWPRFASGGADDPFAMPNLPTVDLDADGIPDNNEDSNSNGLLDPGETNPDNDNTDGDATPDGAELKTGTDPLDPNSFFRILNFELNPSNHILLTWPSAPGALYRVESSTTLITPWSLVQDDIPAEAAGSTTIFDAGLIPLDDLTLYRSVLK